MEHIVERDGVFLLNMQSSSYLLMVNEHGHLEQLHYGVPVKIEDAQALRYKRTMPYGTEIMYSHTDESYCLDNVPLNWSGIGKGDFRVTPLELQMPDGSYTSDFIFERYELREGTYPAETLPCAYAEDGQDAETLILYLWDKVYHIGIELIYTVYIKEDVMTRRAVLTNSEEKPLVIRRMMSMLIDLPNRDYNMLTLDGDWIAEANRHDRALMSGCFVNESTTGSSSNRHNPGVILAEKQTNEDRGAVYGFNLVYSGNHYTAVERSPRNMVRVITGINPLCFSWTLQRDERFETPEAVMTFSAQGFNGMSRNFHSFINRNIVRGDWKGRERPILLNNWEAHFFKFTRRKLLRLARRAEKLGVELFVLDDGWFGARNNDSAGLGDYDVNRKKLPDGIGGLGKRITSMGLRFGLWFEPESVNLDSDLYRAHPDYAIKLPIREPSLGRNQLLLDLTNPAVRNYIVENVSRVLDSADISYVKWDMNRHMSDCFSMHCNSGEFFHRYTLGLYEVLGRIFRPRPHILLESCSSGGNRFDLGMLCYSPQIWASDDTDPIERLRIQRGLSYFYPPSTMGAHVSQSPHQQTLRQTPLSTRFNVAAFGAFGYELDLGELSSVEKRQVRAQIEFYKKYRRTFQFGDFYRYDGADSNRETFLSVNRDKSEAVLAFVQTLAKAGASNDTLCVKGLDNCESYILETVPQKVGVSHFGGLIKHIAPVKLRTDGFILRTVNRYYALTDGALSFTASGAALQSGIGLNNQFIGTGYHRNLRLWSDFSSQMYTVRLMNHQVKKDEGKAE